VIRGLRLLPWLQEAARSDADSVAHFTDCTRCLTMLSPSTRQAIGCGFLPPRDDARAWVHRGADPTALDGLPEVCPGYACKLPEVVEASRARLHWEKGTLRERCGGEPTDATLAALEELEVAAGHCQAWTVEQSNQKART
jgi:hypothetical protein